MIKIIESIWNKKGKYRIIHVLALIMMVLIVVYMTNGTTKSYSHFIYLPIILAAYYWGSTKALIVAAIAGILLGLIPLDVAQGISQDTMNWIIRAIILAIIGYVTGALFERVHKLSIDLKDKELISEITGLYNSKKLFHDLTSILEGDETFTIISIKLANIEGIGKYVSYDLVQKLIGELIEDIKLRLKNISLYSSSDDELMMIIPEDYDYVKGLKSLVNKYSMAVKVDGFQVRLSLKAGVYNYMGGLETPITIYNKARIASEQGETPESGVYYYDIKIDNSRKERYEIAGSIHNALMNKEFYLLYQPKINIVDNTISGVEVLLRWDRGKRKPIGPNVFIDVAEKIGFIKEISKYVIENAIRQISIWENENVVVNFAINITSQELIDQELIEWVTDIMDYNKIDRSKFELEITERVIGKDSERINKILEYLRQIGYKISIDDFGTGYNSLIMLGSVPYDILKIDKYFIDRISKFEDRVMIKNLIEHLHALKKKVVAEGVETDEQLKYLKECGCDEIQGYYFSKPLTSEEFVQFYKKFYKDRS